MNAVAIPAWKALAPEISFLGLILGVFALNLRRHQVKLDKIIYLSLAGFALTFLLLTMGETGRVSLFGASFLLDPLAVFTKGLVLGAGALILFMTREHSKALKDDHAHDFVLLILFSLLSAFFVASAGDLITLFISIEWMTISLYVLTTYLKRDACSLEAGAKYLVMGTFSAALFLYGISLVYNTLGAIQFDKMVFALNTATGSPLLLVGVVLICAGIGFKITAFPFQFWAPDVYQGSPIPITAFLSVVSKSVGFVALIKMMFFLTAPQALNWHALFGLLSVASLFYGNLGALSQINVKRLLAYSAIGHAGYLLMGITCESLLGIQAVLFYLVAYAISNGAAFFAVTIANRELEGETISAYSGLAKKSPLLAATLFLSLLSLGGIPPLIGFFGKFLIFQAAIEQGYLWLAVIGAVNVVISLYFYLRLIKEMYLKRGIRGKKIRLRKSAQYVLLALSLFMIVLGVYQAPLFNLTHTSALTIF
jgi:NADH-quinone oxidoreductase subunit N